MSDPITQVNPGHDHYMNMALLEARKAFDEDEVPVGAVLVDQKGDVLSTGRNRTIYFHDPSAHAEILAIRAAGQKLKNYRILNTTLYVTVEPCVMCMGAIIHARIGCLVFGAYDSKWGAVGSVYEFDKDHRFNHRPDIFKGVCEAQCRQLMVDFFKIKRCGGLLDNNQDRYII